MKIYRCDRCGEVFSSTFSLPMRVYTESSPTLETIWHKLVTVTGEEIHLCQKCNDELEKIIEPWWKALPWYGERVEAFRES